MNRTEGWQHREVDASVDRLEQLLRRTRRWTLFIA